MEDCNFDLWKLLSLYILNLLRVTDQELVSTLGDDIKLNRTNLNFHTLVPDKIYVISLVASLEGDPSYQAAVTFVFL